MFRDRNLIEGLWLGEKIPQKVHHIKQDRYDSTMFKEIYEHSKNLKILEKEAPETFIPLIQDIWAQFYKAEPELENENDVDFGHKVNRPFIERVREDPETENTRLTTMLDELCAAVAANGTARALLKEINEREALREAFQKAGLAGMKMKNGEEKEAEQMMGEAEQALQGAARDVRRAVKEAIKTGQEKAEETKQALAGWGLEPGDLQHMSMGDRMQLVQNMTYHEVKKISDLVGRMRNMARARQREVIKKRRDEIHSITIGAEIPHVLPQELGALKHPLRKLDFYRRFTEQQLLQYDLQSQEKLAKGPMVIMVDISGSMSGEPLDWAIACALALVDTASRQKRHSHVIFFDTEVKKEFSFAPGEKNIDKYLQMAQIGPAGGTDYAPAIEEASSIISEKTGQKEYQEADMVIITDGECLLSAPFLHYLIKWKEATKTSNYAVLIGKDAFAEHRLKDHPQGLNGWNDRVWKLTRFGELSDGIAGELFEVIV